jgi:hypothetical protein
MNKGKRDLDPEQSFKPSPSIIICKNNTSTSSTAFLPIQLSPQPNLMTQICHPDTPVIQSAHVSPSVHYPSTYFTASTNTDASRHGNPISKS